MCVCVCVHVCIMFLYRSVCSNEMCVLMEAVHACACMLCFCKCFNVCSMRTGIDRDVVCVHKVSAQICVLKMKCEC